MQTSFPKLWFRWNSVTFISKIKEISASPTWVQVSSSAAMTGTSRTRRVAGSGARTEACCETGSVKCYQCSAFQVDPTAFNGHTVPHDHLARVLYLQVRNGNQHVQTIVVELVSEDQGRTVLNIGHADREVTALSHFAVSLVNAQSSAWRGGEV